MSRFDEACALIRRREALHQKPRGREFRVVQADGHYAQAHHQLHATDEREMLREATAPAPEPDRITSDGPLARVLKAEAPVRVRGTTRDDGYRYVESLLGRRFDRRLGCWVRG